MIDQVSLPFHSFSFTLVEGKRPRAAFRMRAADGGLYELHVEKGSAANPVSQFTRSVPLEVAERLRDALQAAGVFDWEGSYGNDPSREMRRWTMSLVFKEDVFAITSKGGSDVPAGFDQVLDELYKLDFPRPAAQASQQGASASGPGHMSMGSALGALGSMGFSGSFGGLSAGDLGAYGSVGENRGVDFSQMADLLQSGEMPGLDPSAMNELLSEAQRNPQAIQQRMRDEFRHMSPDEQNRMLDALASTGMASREWWRRFLSG